MDWLDCVDVGCFFGRNDLFPTYRCSRIGWMDGGMDGLLERWRNGVSGASFGFRFCYSFVMAVRDSLQRRVVWILWFLTVL